MRTAIIPDIHGRDWWKAVTDMKVDEVIFLGDYFDNPAQDPNEGYYNFQQIAEFEDDYSVVPVTLLVGNHDVHYFQNWGETYSGWNSITHLMLFDQLNEMRREGRLKIAAYRTMKGKPVVISHAGVSYDWLQIAHDELGIANAMSNEMAQDLNLCFRTGELDWMLTHKFGAVGAKKRNVSPIDIAYGNSPEFGPLWIRPYALSQSNRHDFDTFQIVGHTCETVLMHYGNFEVVDVYRPGITPQQRIRVYEFDDLPSKTAKVRF